MLYGKDWSMAGNISRIVDGEIVLEMKGSEVPEDITDGYIVEVSDEKRVFFEDISEYFLQLLRKNQ